MQRKLFSLNEEAEFVEFSNLLAPPLIEVYNLLEVNLLLHKYLPKILLRRLPCQGIEQTTTLHFTIMLLSLIYLTYKDMVKQMP